MPAATIQTTIRLVGEDRASAAIKGAADAMDHAGKSAKHAAESTEAIAEKSGDLERGFRGFKDVLGQASPALQDLTDKFGGIEALLKGFGPKFGAVGIAIAAVGAGALYVYNQMEEARKKEVQTRIDLIDKAKDDLALQSKLLGVNQELLGKKADEVTVEGVLNDARKTADKLLDLQKQKLEAQKEKQDEKVATIGVEISQLSAALVYDEKRLAVAKQLAADKAGQEGEATKAATAEMRHQADIAGILDAKTRLAAQEWDAREKIRIAVADEKRIQREIAGAWGEDNARLAKQQQDAVKAQIDGEKALRAVAAEGQSIREARIAKEKAAAQAAHQKHMERERQKAETADMLAQNQNEIAARATEIANQEFLAAKALADVKLDAADKIRAAQIELATDPAEKARLQLIEVEIKETRDLAAAKAELAYDDEARELRSVQIAAEANAKRMALLDAERQRETQLAQSKVDSALRVASAVEGGLERMGVAERVAAGLKAVISVAEGALAFARQDYAGAAAGAFAAVEFGSVALGFTGGSAGTGAGGGQSFTQASSAAPQQSGATGGGSIIINYNKGFYGAPQENAKGIAGALKSLKGTGLPAWKGA